MKKFLLFGLLAYGPFLLFWIPFAQGLVVHLLIPGDSAPFVRFLAPFLVLPWIIVFGIYRRVQRAKESREAISMLYLGWLGLGGIASYMMLLAVGGASMAVADGGAAPSLSREATLRIAPTLAILHVVILPWLFLSVRLLRKRQLLP